MGLVQTQWTPTPDSDGEGGGLGDLLEILEAPGLLMGDDVEGRESCAEGAADLRDE